jgi:hypothetical protein
MTEYDYSPEAYERYLATQNRIAKWVDETEHHRSEFKHAVPTGSSRDSSPEASLASKLKKAIAPRRRPKPNLFINPPPPSDDSSSGDDSYGPGPGPMPLSAPGIMFAAPHSPMYAPMMAPATGVPMLSPPPMMMPQTTYITSPHGSSSHRHHHGHSSSHGHHRSHSYVRSPGHLTPAGAPGPYYAMASPPVSPGYQYMYPPMSGGSAHPGYIMMPAQQAPYGYGGHHQKSRTPSIIYARPC